MSQNEQDEYEPSAEELEALLDESKLTNEYIRQLEADFMPVTKLENTFDTAIVVDNLPVVGEDKREKLMRIIHKIYSQFGPIRDNGFCLPTDSKGTTKGYAFIEFDSPEVARLATEKTQGHKLDKQHIFAVNLYSDFEKLMAVPDEYVPPQVKDHEEGDNLRWWLQEPRGMEQYVIRQGEETEIYWNEILRKPEPIYKRSRWTDTYVRWSPRGSYMATLHVPGVILWGGEKWNKINRFQHPGVKLIDFSPCENFLITWSPQFLEHDNPKDPQCIIIWDIKKGTKLRGLPAGLLGPNGIHPWPNFFWTHDDKYFARLGKDAIMVYDSSDMTLLDKKSIKIPGVRDFAWSPTEHVFACWVPEEGNSPARVILREIPSRKEIRNKTLFNVSDCKIHWQEQGNFLCVKVDRYTKKKKSTYTNFELFRIRENGMPSELLEVKDTILWFAWEPRGKRFAIIHGDGNLRYNVSIYRMGKNQLKHLVTLENRAANTLSWSPRGSFLVLAGLRNLNGTLEFYNADELQTMGEGDHFMCTDLEWDPTGRYLSTSVSAWRQQMESGYTIWRFDGKIIHKIMKDRFFQFHWRPRPPSLLTDEQEIKIRKNIKEYTKRFAQLDAKEKKQFKSAHFAEKQRLIDEFAEWENRWRQAAEAERAQREKIPVRSSVRPDQFEEIVEKVEEVVEIIEEEL